MDLSEYEGILDNITKVKTNGWWQVYVTDEDKDDYEPLGNRILFLNGKFYDKSSKEPWKEEEVIDIGNMMNLYNKDGYPYTVIKLEDEIHIDKKNG